MFSGSSSSKQLRTTATNIVRQRKQDGALTTSGFDSHHLFPLSYDVGRCWTLLVSTQRPRKHMVYRWKWDSVCNRNRAITTSGLLAAILNIGSRTPICLQKTIRKWLSICQILHHGLYGSTSCYYKPLAKVNGKTAPAKVSFLAFFISSARAQVATLDRFLPKLACKCGFGQGCAFWGSRWWPIMFRGLDPKNRNFGCMNIHFKPNLQKNQIAISLKLFIGFA